MNTRQREFCRHYLEGKSAKEAAHAAGYAYVTAEKNAARLLASPQVSKRIARLREARGKITMDHFDRVLKRVMHTIDFIGDEKIMLQAARQFVQLVKAQKQIEVESLVDELEEREQREAEQSASICNPTLQLLDLQGKPVLPTEEEKQQEKEKQEEEKADRLATGQIAFDLRLTLMKADYSKPRTPLKVIFQPMAPPDHAQRPPN